MFSRDQRPRFTKSRLRSVNSPASQGEPMLTGGQAAALPPVSSLPMYPVPSFPVTPLPATPSEQSVAALPMRQPLLIPGSGKKSAGIKPPPIRNRLLVHVSVSVLCVCILLGALLAVVPAGAGGHTVLSQLFAPHTDMTTTKSNNTALIAAQAATAVSRYDGYDPGGTTAVSGGGLLDQNASDGVHLARFYYGQCTYWANYRYHQLTGTWIPWLGNAYQWYANAIAAGWQTSDSPNPNGPSIIVLGPYAQGSYSYYGHVGVVESPQSIHADGTVTTSNWHYPYLGVLSYVDFKFPAPGTHFIWAS